MDPIYQREVANTIFRSGTREWYHPVMLGPSTIAELATRASVLRAVRGIIRRMEPDDYTTYLDAYYQSGLDRFGDHWRYADIVTVLHACATLLRPKDYLEIGVRRGRSMGIVIAQAPECNALGFDMWKKNYAGMENPGEDFVRGEMKKLGLTGKLELISGNTHETMPKFFRHSPNRFFDLVTVDGDHTEVGAEQDIRDVLEHIKLGGAIVFDDICHPAHPYLQKVWSKTVGADRRFSTWEFTELGYGVAFGIRRG